jgi:hypothetical protein
MPGKRISTVSVLVLCGAALLGAADYFPLATGNAWVYKSSQGTSIDTQTIEVGSAQLINGQEHYNVIFLGRPVLLRASDDGTLLAYDAATGADKQWIAFGATEGQPFQTSIDACVKMAQIDSRSAKYSGPAGTYNNAAQLSFQLSCADAGITSQTWVPGIGLVQHSETTIAGEKRYELMYATVGATRVDGGEQGLMLAIDQPIYTAAPDGVMLARLTLRNSFPGALFTIGGGQQYDLIIRNDKDAIVYQWSAGKVFPLILSQQISGIAELNYAISVLLAELPAGRYMAEATIPRAEGKQYAASVGFEIRTRP